MLPENTSPNGSQDLSNVSDFVDQKIAAWEAANPRPEITVPSDAPVIVPRAFMHKDWALSIEATSGETLQLTLCQNPLDEHPVIITIELAVHGLEPLVTILLDVEAKMEMHRLYHNHGKRLNLEQRKALENWEAARDKATVAAFQEFKRKHLK